MRLPAAPCARQDAGRAAQTLMPTPAACRFRLLIVDDDPLSSTFQAHLASLLGHEATVESEPARAVELAQSGRFDLLLLDLSMPHMDGFEALRRLREQEAQQHRAPLPVVAVTGYSSEADRLRCLMAGFNEHLSKPIQAATLSATLVRLLGERVTTSGAQDSDAERLRATVRRLSEVKPADRGFAPTVTESFALRSAQLIETLQATQRDTRSDDAVRAARALRASAEFLGALRLAEMSAHFETLAGAERWSETAAVLHAIENEHQVVLTLLFESSR